MVRERSNVTLIHVCCPALKNISLLRYSPHRCLLPRNYSSKSPPSNVWGTFKFIPNALFSFSMNMAASSGDSSS